MPQTMTSMKTKVNRNELVKMCYLIFCFFVPGYPALSAESVMRDRYDNLDSLKKGIPWVSKSWEAGFRGKGYVVCLQDHPSYGQSRQQVFAWRKETDGSLTLVWNFRTTGIGPIDVEVDESKGGISVRAKGYGPLKDSVIAFVNLGATGG
jgi:hypothetical protein